jgi:carbon-monoxide dehydrogenase medium subunit
MFPVDFSYARATSLNDALARLAAEAEAEADVKVLAGGQSLLPMMKLRLAAPELIIDIGGLMELKGVTIKPDGSTAIGALTTYRDLQRDERVTAAYPAIADALTVLADPQVRARGTVGGCVAHGDPAADLPAVLLALGAHVTIAGRDGIRAVPLDGFLLDVYTTDLAPHELVTAITLPPGPLGQAYEKFEQPASHLPLAGACAVAEVTDGVLTSARVTVTGVASRPFRSLITERTVAGLPLSAALPDVAALGIAESMAEAGLTALGDQHASAPFRVHLAGVLAGRALARALDRATASSDD